MPPQDSVRAPLGGLREAALLGVATGARTFSGVGALALHGRLRGARIRSASLSGAAPLALPGRLGGPRIRTAIIVAAAGDLACDKLPFVPARTHPSGLAGRMTTAGVAGYRVGGPSGAAAGSVIALGSALAGYRARTLLTQRLPVPDPLVGAAEDAVALCCVAVA